MSTNHRTEHGAATAPGPLSFALRWSTYAFLFCMPLSVTYPLGRPFAAGILPLYVSPAVEPSDVFGILLLLLSLLQASQRRSQRIATSWYHWPFVVLLLGLALVAIIGASAALAPMLALYTAARWLFCAALVWAIARAPISTARLVSVFLLSMSVQALVAIIQVTWQSPLGLPGEMALPLTAPGTVAVRVDGHRWLRASGLTFHPNVLGGFLAVGLLIALPLLTLRLPRLLWYLLLIGLATTLSRSAGLALALALIPAAVWVWHKKPALRRPALSVTLGLLCLSAAIGWQWRAQLLSRVQIVAPNGSFSLRYVVEGERLEMVHMAWQMFTWRPLLGIGAGNCPLAMRNLLSTRKGEYVHNVPLLIAAEIGLGGVLLWFALFVIAARTLLLHAHSDPWIAVAGVAWMALGIIGLFDCYPWSLNAGRMLSATVLALLQRSTLPQQQVSFAAAASSTSAAAP